MGPGGLEPIPAPAKGATATGAERRAPLDVSIRAPAKGATVRR